MRVESDVENEKRECPSSEVEESEVVDVLASSWVAGVLVDGTLGRGGFNGAASDDAIDVRGDVLGV
jgi:hypothetical protein